MSRIPGLDGGDTGELQDFLLGPAAATSIWRERSEPGEPGAGHPRPQSGSGIDVRTRLLAKLDRVIYAAGGLPVEWRMALCSLKTTCSISRISIERAAALRGTRLSVHSGGVPTVVQFHSNTGRRRVRKRAGSLV